MFRKTYQREVRAEPEVVFDLCRSIDFHLQAAQSIQARAVAGQTTGLAGEGCETVYSARFFGFRFRLRMRVGGVDPPHEFRDEMVQGLFSHFSHHYRITASEGGCLLEDTFAFSLPLAPIGWPIERTLITPAIQRAQVERLDAIKREAEK